MFADRAMNLSISNIAWDRNEDDLMASMLDSHGIRYIDVAPGKYFPDIAGASDSAIRDVRQWWASRDISVAGMQALFFGTQGLNMFAPPESSDRMLSHLGHVFRIAEGLGARRLVFGAPKNRDRGTLTLQDADSIAIEFFHRAGESARNHGVVLCLEPNPPCYGSNFMTTTIEAADIVTRLAHPNVGLQWDTGAAFINEEDVEELVSRFAPIIGHIHISEPGLAQIGCAESDHIQMSRLLGDHVDAQHIMTIEMLRPASGTRGIEEALRFTQRHYGPQAIEASLR